MDLDMHDASGVPLQRRRLLKMLALPSIPALLLGCVGSVPPRDYKRPRTHIVGGNGKRGRSRGGA